MRRILALAAIGPVVLAGPAIAQQEGPPDAVAAGADVALERPATVAAYGYPPLSVDQDAILELLRSSRFDDLESLFDSLETAVASDITAEVDLDAAYRSFYGSDPTIGPRLDEWVSAYPGSDAALVARTQFHLARAWASRGEAVRIADPDGFRSSQAEALTDALRALEIDPENLGAHAAALRIFRSIGWTVEARAMTEESLARFPTSFWLRHIALGFMEPRWGGSFELMREFAEDAQRFVDQNPRLGALRTVPIIEEAATLSMSHRYDEALEKLEEARPLGVDWDFYYQRGRTLFHDDQPRSAVAVLDSAYAIRPVSEEVLEYQGWALYWTARVDASPGARVSYLERSIADLSDARERSQEEERLSEVLAEAVSARATCTAEPVTCFDGPEYRTVTPQRRAQWVTAWILAITVPLLLLSIGTWSFIEWRRQAFWTPRVVHFLGALTMLAMIASNVAWVGAGGEMGTFRYVVAIVIGLFPYLTYLVLLGPRLVGRKRRATADGPMGAPVM